MNPRQRRGALLMILAAFGAVAVFVSVLGYVGSVRAEVGTKLQVLRLKVAVPAYGRLDPGMVERVEVPRKWTPRTMLTDPGAVAGKVAPSELVAGSYLQQGMLIDAPVLQPGQREIAIMIDAETGVAGKVRPGMSVDIYATFQQQAQQNQRSCASRIIRRALVIQVGAVTRERTGTNNQTLNAVVPITFALSADDSVRLTYAEAFAAHVRLALIGGDQNDPVKKLGAICDIPAAR
ncbi:Flp pilus assembly protein CpaB [Actinomadura rubrisoli]|uniref:Flp pilus assembly protein CpaB n=1 Tax=Actinomadura rubrisoli TaxID=2530368 RepID=A0A4R4ZUG2_9ACTN|nr:Flp pilus assembly protein CpaB [Actinomadura rubrisoli]TDD62110.1 Flp pilus assembly protein CpaB [Actinomadura rubrisoli]